jgi:hypothetical protein
MVPLRNPISGGDTTIASPMFPTDLDPATYCEPSLLAEPQPWEFSIELTPTGTLGKLG